MAEEFEWTPCVSSNIKRCGFRADGTIAVEFHSGSVHEYPDFTRDDFDALIGAESVGKHFHANIRNRKKE